jgi:hypothetical protein
MIIGLSGYIGSGKSTIAEALADYYGCEGRAVKIMSFATPIRLMLGALFEYAGGDAADLRSQDIKMAPHPILLGQTPRHAMQTLGTEWGRDCMNSDLWSAIGIMAAKSSSGGWRDVVIFDDVRFPNEGFAIRGAEGQIFKLSRPGVERTSHHASEDLNVGYCTNIKNDDIPAKVAMRIVRALVVT